MGGLTTILSGDWRQCLPVVKRGTKPDIMNRTLKRSKLWKHVQKYKLEVNMRLKTVPVLKKGHFMNGYLEWEMARKKLSLMMVKV